MSAPLVVPFNFQPASISVQSGTYTIPAGFYGYVTAYVHGASTFNINGSGALLGVIDSTSQTTLSSSTLDTIDFGSFPNLGQALAVNTAPTGINNPAFSASSTTFTDTKVAVGTYWVPTGTILSVTGTVGYTVTLYANIT